LLYYHARYYDPALARFISADSIVPGQTATSGAPNPQQLNRYSYGLNNPVKNTDPTGHCIEDLCIGEAALLAAAAAAAEPEIEQAAQEATPAVEAAAEKGSELLSQAGEAVAATATGVSEVIETKFLSSAAEGDVCWNCVLKAVGGEGITGSGNEMYGALKDLGYETTNTSKPNDVALFTGKAFEDTEGAFSVVKHAAIFAGNSPEATFLSNNVTEGGKPAEAARYYTLSQIHKMAEGLKDATIEFFNRR